MSRLDFQKLKSNEKDLPLFKCLSFTSTGNQRSASFGIPVAEKIQFALCFKQKVTFTEKSQYLDTTQGVAMQISHPLEIFVQWQSYSPTNTQHIMCKAQNYTACQNTYLLITYYFIIFRLSPLFLSLISQPFFQCCSFWW